MFCPSCGNETPDEGIFCFNCGTRVNKECPRCAEIIKIKAKVCRFCGYEFTVQELAEIEQIKQVSRPIVNLPQTPASSVAPLKLTVEEHRVLELLAEGRSNIEIADILAVPVFFIQDEYAARIHASMVTQDLLKKFGVSDKTELIKQARQKGYLPSK